MVLRYVKYFIRCMGGNMISELLGGSCLDLGFRLFLLGVRFLILFVNKVDMFYYKIIIVYCRSWL